MLTLRYCTEIFLPSTGSYYIWSQHITLRASTWKQKNTYFFELHLVLSIVIFVYFGSFRAHSHFYSACFKIHSVCCRIRLLLSLPSSLTTLGQVFKPQPLYHIDAKCGLLRFFLNSWYNLCRFFLRSFFYMFSLYFLSQFSLVRNFCGFCTPLILIPVQSCSYLRTTSAHPLVCHMYTYASE